MRDMDAGGIFLEHYKVYSIVNHLKIIFVLSRDNRLSCVYNVEAPKSREVKQVHSTEKLKKQF